MLFRQFICIAALTRFAIANPSATETAKATPDQVVSSIKAVTTISASLNVAVGSISTSTSSSQLSTIATTVTNGFTTIITSVANAVTMIGSTMPFDANGATIVVNVLEDFIKIHQALLSTVIGKHGILAQFGLTAPLVPVLQSLEAGIDAFAGALIALIPSKKNTAQNGFMALDASVTNTISVYSQLCVPNPLYPTLMPICVNLGGLLGSAHST